MSADSGSPASMQGLPANGQAREASSSARRKSLQSGFSLLARGEPKIWFAGGMLVVCLAMIVGLLGLILVSGLPSFWARPIDLLALDDGTLEIGQLQSVRPEVLGPTTLIDEELPPAATDSADADNRSASTAAQTPGRDAALKTQRRYYRTGNFRLTGRHYRWLSSSELGKAGIGRPEWALVVERVAWGRLYGLPLTVETQLIPDEGSQKELALVADLGEIFEAISASNDDRLSAIRSALERAARDLKDSALRAQIVAREGTADGELRVQTTDSDDWKPFNEILGTDKLTAALRKWSDYPAAFAALQANLQQVIRQRAELEHRKYEISRLDAQLSELRVDVRRAEIESGVQAAVQVDTAHYLLEQQEALASRRAIIPELKEGLQRFLPAENEQASEAGALLGDALESKLSEKSAVLEEQLAEWMAPAESQPQLLLEAIADYCEGYRAIVRKKQPLEKRLIELEAQLDLTQADFALPTGSVAIPDVSDDDMDSLLRGALTDSVRAQLANQNIQLAASLLEVEKLSEILTLISVKDLSGDKQLLALTSPGYASAITSTPRVDAAVEDPAPRRQLMLMGVHTVGCREIVRAVDVNRLGLGGKLEVYVARWREFLLENPREANTEGGVFPAIWGTIVMTLIMTIVVVPFGVMAALYLREYTRSGVLVSLIRISINNLAGVPSIVYGVFGFSFFCYTIGAYIDGGAKNADIAPWPSITWYSMLGLVAVVGTAAFFFSFFSGVPTHKRTPLIKWMSRAAVCCWLASLALFAILMLKSPFFSGFYQEYLPNPTFGKGGLLWAALTLALLTLPVVIVATEEALAAVPNSLREGSLACGASKWQTIWRIVLPHARPGILTGAILAMARGAGEVAPLMLVGALPSAPDLPLDGEFPFIHGSRSFMHLGYQIFTLGFQSQNSEAAKPMVFTCTLLLILIVAALNLFAVFLRARLKRRFHGTQF